MFTRLSSDNRGNVALLFGIALLPLAGLIGAAVDYSHATSIRAEMQQAADAAALAAAGATDASEDERKKLANAVFDKNAPQSQQLKRIKRELTVEDGVYTMTAKGTYSTGIISAVGIDSMAVGVLSKVGVGFTQGNEIVFAFDGSGMNLNGCWCQVEHAVQTALETFKTNCHQYDFKASVINFSDRVNVGMSRAPWAVTKPTPADWQGCLEPREQTIGANSHALTDDGPISKPFAPTAAGYSISSIGTGYGSPTGYCPTQPIMGPTSSVTDVTQAIASIGNGATGGYGRYDEAMAWAWRLLSPKWTNEWGTSGYPAAYGRSRKIVVFMSDGYTNAYKYEVNASAGFGNNLGSQEGFANFASMCSQMKANGIEIDIITPKNVNPNFEPYAKQCATSSDTYYSIDSTSDFKLAFDKITTRGLVTYLSR